MSAVVAGVTRGVAEVIDGFLRPPPMGVELSKVGHMTILRDEVIVGGLVAEVAQVLWDTHEDVNVTLRQYVVIDNVRSWSNEVEAGVKRAGNAFPPFHRFTRRWRGRITTVDAEFTVGVRVPAGRLWEHRRWVAAGGPATIQTPAPQTPAEHIPRQLRGEAVAAGIRFMAVLRR